MPKILLPDIHKNLTNNLSRVFASLGYEVLIPCYKASCRPPKPVKDFVWNETWTQKTADKFFSSKVKVVNLEQILDEKPEIVFITAYENQFEILNIILPQLPSTTKLVWYSGNDYWFGAYPLEHLKNYICADYTGYTIAYRYNVNHLYYRPWINYDIFKFQGSSKNTFLGSYINGYKENFPQDYITFNDLNQAMNGISMINHENLTQQIVSSKMNDSLASIHIKRLEGYGYSIIESMACGRPVFLPTVYKSGKSYQFWAIEGETAYYFSNIQEFHQKLNHYASDEQYRLTIQENCAKKIRQYINNEEQTYNLKIFLENLL